MKRLSIAGWRAISMILSSLSDETGHARTLRADGDTTFIADDGYQVEQ
jgi:hypothetical protein